MSKQISSLGSLLLILIACGIFSVIFIWIVGDVSEGVPPVSSSSSAPIAKVPTPQYRDEIFQYVIDPCFAQISSRNLTEYVSGKHAVDLLKITEKEGVENVISMILPMIKGTTFKERKTIYEFGLNRCLSGAGF